MISPALLEAYVRNSGLSYSQTSNSFVFTCPRCNSPKKLYIRKSDGRFVCWKCRETDNFQGRPEFALAELCSSTLKSVRDALYGDGGAVDSEIYLDVELDGWTDDDIIIEPVRQVFWPLDFYEIDDHRSEKGATYLFSRGVSIDIAKFYGIRYCPPKQCIVYPIQHKGRLYGWQTRRITQTKFVDVEAGAVIEIPKALTSKGVKKDRLLMFADRVSGGHVVLCEGPMDAIHAHLCGGNVATMGKSVSKQQLDLVINSGVTKVYLALDPDASDEIERCAQAFFDAGIQVFDLIPRSAKDLGEMPLEEVHSAFLCAQPICSSKLWIYLK